MGTRRAKDKAVAILDNAQAAAAILEEDLYSKPGHLLRRAHQISVAIFSEECRAYDLTSVQYASLVAIQHNPGLDATRLSTLIFFDRSTLGGVLERLEAKDLIMRGPSKEDKRVKLLYLTAKGQVLLRQVKPLVEQVQRRIVAKLTREKQHALLEILSELVEVNRNMLPNSIKA
ncbi:MAG: MarR family winged helix-turn-helix transcriptional regulator [Sphingomonadaceae bacterium]